MVSEFIWDPDRNIFIIPYLNHPVTWYGFLFALGFLVGFFLVRKMFTFFLLSDPLTLNSSGAFQAAQLTDRLAVLIVSGGVIGARLGHVFFYDWPHYKDHPLAIFKVWEGGLASHGGAIGILIALILFVYISRACKPKMTFLVALDAIVVPVAFGGGCIRIGNFINQEITGIPTSLFWAVKFMHPLDGFPGVAVHPVQLYESFFYFLVFTFLFLIWKKNKTLLGKGVLSGWFLLLVFGFRFFIDYLKMPQNILFDSKRWLAMGQLLSIPFILFGILLLIRYCYVREKK